MHEAQLHDENCFLTLTYDDDHLPAGRSLRCRDVQLFMKRYRKRIGRKIKFYHCGEYGDATKRPHYHACIFGHGFHEDRRYLKKSDSGEPLYRSALLEDLWRHGNSSVGELTFESACYVARYCTKKITGYAADFHYAYTDENGEWAWRQPEYATQSNGLGEAWLSRFAGDVYPGDFIIVPRNSAKPIKAKPPRYYDKKHQESEPEAYERLKGSRLRNAKADEANQTSDRLRVRERVAQAKAGLVPGKL